MVSPSPQNSSISQKHNDNATLQPKLTTKKPTNTILIIERSATCTNKKEDIMRQSPVTLSPKVNSSHAYQEINTVHLPNQADFPRNILVALE